MVYGTQLSTPNDLKELYWGEGYTMREIADKYDTNLSEVQKWFNIEHIHRRKGCSKYYVPFGGDVDDAIKLLKQRDDLFIRCFVEHGDRSYNVSFNDGLKVVLYDQQTEDVSQQYVESLFESYETRLCYKDDYNSFNE